MITNQMFSIFFMLLIVSSNAGFGFEAPCTDSWGGGITGSISGHNLKCYGGYSISECKLLCSAEPNCLSIDVRNSDGRCCLGNCQISGDCTNDNDDGWTYHELSRCRPHACPPGFVHTFSGKTNGECQQNEDNEGETLMDGHHTLESCARACRLYPVCHAFDYKVGACYLNMYCDEQNEGDDYFSCKRDDGRDYRGKVWTSNGHTGKPRSGTVHDSGSTGGEGEVPRSGGHGFGFFGGRRKL